MGTCQEWHSTRNKPRCGLVEPRSGMKVRMPRRGIVCCKRLPTSGLVANMPWEVDGTPRCGVAWKVLLDGYRQTTTKKYTAAYGRWEQWVEHHQFTSFPVNAVMFAQYLQYLGGGGGGGTTK